MIKIKKILLFWGFALASITLLPLDLSAASFSHAYLDFMTSIIPNRAQLAQMEENRKEPHRKVIQEQQKLTALQQQKKTAQSDGQETYNIDEEIELQKKIVARLELQANLEHEVNKIEAEAIKAGLSTLSGLVTKSTPDQTAITIQKNKAVIKAQNAPALEKARWEGIGNASKKIIGYGTLATLITMLGYFSIKYSFNKRPTIIEQGDTSIRSLSDKIRGIKPPRSNMGQLVLSEYMQEKVSAKFAGIERAIQQNLPLSNMLFHGPAGTGKTMAAQAFAREMSEKDLAHHVIIRGSVFKRLGSTQKAQRALADVLRWAKRGTKKKPVIFIFDEAESMFIDRESSDATELTRDLTTTMLSFFERAVDTNKMVIFSTNLPHKLDRAMLNRVDKSNWVHFEKPGKTELEKLLDVYYNLHLVQNQFEVPEDVRAHIPTAAANLLKHEAVGREVDSFAAQLVYRMLNAETRTLSPKMVEQGLAARNERHELSAY